ncbi:MAG: hypothetical protein P4L22_05055 [Candidatus Babeliales bacterium]|nr:hypothetical protein [Candidatus Babeliales bacterium]
MTNNRIIYIISIFSSAAAFAICRKLGYSTKVCEKVAIIVCLTMFILQFVALKLTLKN